MQKTVYNYITCCRNCHNRVEFPLLSDFEYGELICQTKDAKDFYGVCLLDNPVFSFIIQVLEYKFSSQTAKPDPQPILLAIADQELSPLRICPNCMQELKDVDTERRSSESKISYATWNIFEGLEDTEKIDRIMQIAAGLDDRKGMK